MNDPNVNNSMGFLRSSFQIANSVAFTQRADKSTTSFIKLNSTDTHPLVTYPAMVQAPAIESLGGKLDPVPFCTYD